MAILGFGMATREREKRRNTLRNQTRALNPLNDVDRRQLNARMAYENNMTPTEFANMGSFSGQRQRQAIWESQKNKLLERAQQRVDRARAADARLPATSNLNTSPLPGSPTTRPVTRTLTRPEPPATLRGPEAFTDVPESVAPMMSSVFDPDPILQRAQINRRRNQDKQAGLREQLNEWLNLRFRNWLNPWDNE